MTETGRNSGSVSEEETGNAAAASLAGYIAEMSAELALLASRSNLTMLAYFLNLARVEAELRSRELGGFGVISRRSRSA